MRKFRHIVAAFLLLVPGTVGAATLCDPKVGFSADRKLVIDAQTYDGKIWAMPGKERHEQAIHAMRPVFILRNDNPFGEIVVPSIKTIVQFAMPAELKVLATPELKKHPAGSDTVNGISTTKYAIDETVPQGHAEGTLWLSRDGIPMKLVGTFTKSNGKASTVRWELTHVKIGPQPAALFQTPDNYSKLPPEAVAPLLGLRLKSKVQM